jgi:hypothetical protein
MTTFAEETDFPALFKQTYWGNFVREDTDMHIYFNNRNEFAKKYNLNAKSWCKDKIPYEYKMRIRCMEAEYAGHATCHATRSFSSTYDHFECYRTKINDVDSLILIISIHKSENPRSIIKEQWEIVPPLYSRSCVTWQLIVPVSELKKPLTLDEKKST